MVGDVDARQHNLLRAAVELAGDGVADRFEGQGPARSARLPDRTEGAAMVAASLDRDEALDLVEQAGGYRRHDVICRERIEFVGVSDHTRHARQRLKGLRIELGRTARDQDLGVGAAAMGVADRLARLAHRFVRHRAAVDHDPVLVGGGGPRNRLTLRKIEPAAERYCLNAHCSASRSRSPSNTCFAAPRMRIGWPRAQLTVKLPPVLATVTGDSARLVTIAATALAHAPVPQASVSPAPRSKVRNFNLLPT